MNNDVTRQGCPKPGDSRSHVLIQAAKTGAYPPGITANDLAEAREPIWERTSPYFSREGGKTALHYAAEFGNLPAGTTLGLLASVSDARGETALLAAVVCGNLPPEISAKELAAFRLEGGYSILHSSIACQHVPADTTLELMKSTVDEKGWSALHEAATMGSLLPGTTIDDLSTSKCTDGRSALDCFLEKIQNLDNWPSEFEERFLRQVQQLLHASMKSEKAIVESPEQLKRIITTFSKLDRLQTAKWAARELAKLPPMAHEPDGITPRAVLDRH